MFERIESEILSLNDDIQLSIIDDRNFEEYNVINRLIDIEIELTDNIDRDSTEYAELNRYIQSLKQRI